MTAQGKQSDKDKRFQEIGDRLRDVRLALHPTMSITDYAKMLRVGYTSYLNWESGLSRPKPEDAEKFCDALGVTMDWIYRGIASALAQNTAKALSSIPRDSATSRSSDTPD